MERFSGGTKILLIIALVGALNWGLIGFFNFNLVAAIFGGDRATEMTVASRIVYAIVGLSALAAAITIPWAARLERTYRPPAERTEVRP